MSEVAYIFVGFAIGMVLGYGMGHDWQKPTPEPREKGPEAGT